MKHRTDDSALHRGAARLRLFAPADKAVSFVVRARDNAGNEDANKVERQGENLCFRA